VAPCCRRDRRCSWNAARNSTAPRCPAQVPPPAQPHRRVRRAARPRGSSLRGVPTAPSRSLAVVEWGLTVFPPSPSLKRRKRIAAPADRPQRGRSPGQTASSPDWREAAGNSVPARKQQERPRRIKSVQEAPRRPGDDCPVRPGAFQSRSTPGFARSCRALRASHRRE